MGVLRTLVLFLASVGLLELAYPWEIYYGEFNFSWGKTIMSYVLVVSIVTIASAFIAPWVVRRARAAKRNRLSAAIVNSATVFGYSSW